MSHEGCSRSQIEYNVLLKEKMTALMGCSSIEDKNKGIQDLIEELDQRNERLELTLQDEMSWQPNEMKVEIFKNLTERQLIKVIMASRLYEPTAGYVLKKRKCRLISLSFDEETYKSFELYMVVRLRNRDMIISKELSFRKALGKRHYCAKLLHLATAYMDSSKAKIVFTGNCADKLPMLKDFGAVPSEPTRRVKEIIFSRIDLAYILNWISADRLSTDVSAEHLIDRNGKLLVAQCGEVELHCPHDYKRSVDDFMEKCRIPLLNDSEQYFWSESSVFKVLSAHSNGDGPPRRIMIGIRVTPRCTFHRSCDQWNELFDSWLASHTAVFGPPKRNVTFSITRAPNIPEYRLTLTLH